MKLRNKKTGEIIDIDIIENRKDGSWEWQAGKTLHDLAENWEDYKPTEPLIKDEKVRKAVQAWAEASNIGVVKVAPYAVFDIESSACICFYGRVIKDKVDDKKSYTIAELCGEEK